MSRTLLYSTVYLGLHFVLRGGLERRDLRKGDCSHLAVCEDEHGKFLSYTEDTSKNTHGGPKSFQKVSKYMKIRNYLADVSFDITKII